jgi:hypothetical protein
MVMAAASRWPKLPLAVGESEISGRQRPGVRAADHLSVVACRKTQCLAARGWLQRTQTWLPPSHDCGPTATLCEDLTVIAASSCARRFLATPLREIIPS